MEHNEYPDHDNSDYDDEYEDPFNEGLFTLRDEYAARFSPEDIPRLLIYTVAVGLFIFNAISPLKTYPWFEKVAAIIQTVPERWWMFLIGCWVIVRFTETLWSAANMLFRVQAGIRRDLRTITRIIMPVLHRLNE